MFNLSKLPKRNILSNANYSQIVAEKIKLITTTNYSTKVAVRDDIQDKELARTIDRISSIKPKHYKKKSQKPPFAKNLFLGVFDTDILAYPEALDKKMVELLEKDLIPIKDFFENIDDKREKHITKNYLENLSKLKLIGLQASIFNGGRQLTLTETCRYLEEMSENTSRIGVVDSEMLGIQILIKYGTAEQQKKYLNRVMNGEVMVSFCAAEINTNNSQLFQTKAVFSSEKNAWVLNGVKKSIVNGSTADIFIVLAESEKINKEGFKENVVNAFIVERGYGGITSTPCEVAGLDETDISNVAFKNTTVPAENSIGEIDTSNKIISAILTEYRISKGAVLTRLLKNAANNFVKRCLKIDAGSNTLLNADAVKFKIGELATALYAIESTTYLTAGLFDQYENQDCELEAAIVKLISTQYCRDSISGIMNFMGSATYLKDDECNRLYRDCLGHLLLNEPVDSLKLTIALLGLQHAGKSLADTIKILRNPFFNPGIILKRIWTQKRHVEDNPRLTLRLHEYLHPSCMQAAEFLEYGVFRLQFATETLLSRYGPEIVNKHVELSYLSECISDIYVMTAVLARASRSYCIGLRHADIEMDIAMAFVAKAVERVRNNVKKIWNGPYNTADERFMKIGEYAIKQKEYFPSHPLVKNY
ncbi:acyl-coa dehydrogenase [Holotrichia oblita]|uniref:Acyl-coa dehydrogenase n=1 Tax=Holotrichia oblita TaxID=644536 RepID=A0ACB9SW42_HOLOL|nr:acyl-coa dehydrogenase [Holotrichia oblita]